MKATAPIAAKIAVFRKLRRFYRALKGKTMRRKGSDLMAIFPSPLSHLKHDLAGTAIMEHIDMGNSHRDLSHLHSSDKFLGGVLYQPLFSLYNTPGHRIRITLRAASLTL